MRGVHAELLLAAEAADAGGASDESPLQQQQTPDHSNESENTASADEPNDEARAQSEEPVLDDLRSAHALNESDLRPSVDDDLIPSF